LNLYPTRATFHVALAGTLMLASGIATHGTVAVTCGGALLLAVAAGRALSRLSGTRLRRAGFEMVWAKGPRVARVARGEPVILEVLLRNRSGDRVRAANLRTLSSSFLDVTVTPSDVDLYPRTSVTLAIEVKGKRIGRWGIHGLALELRGMPIGGEGLYEVPLVFSNPFGIEVQPWPLAAKLASPRGGRSGRVASTGLSAKVRGDGDELRELRDHVPGDPWKRIAWRASARRGKLIVREMERQERDIVWLVLDVSVEGWGGAPGSAALDVAVDEVAAAAVRHLERGDQVGLAVFASRPRAWIVPKAGQPQAAIIARALAGTSTLVDDDRTELDEHEIAVRLIEHLRPLARDMVTKVKTHDLDELSRIAERYRARAPFDARVPHAKTPRDRALRHYLACFGVEVPPRLDGERVRAESELQRTLSRLATERPRPTIVSVWAPAPSPKGLTVRAVQRLKSRRIAVRWRVPDVVASIGAGQGEGVGQADAVARSVEEAVRIRARADAARADAALRAAGIGTKAIFVPLAPKSARVVEDDMLLDQTREDF
jgi:uncharacterized protein (DUF58 family)